MYVLPKSFQFHMACELALCFIQTCSIFCCFLCRGVFCLRHLIVFYVFCRTLSDDWEQHSLKPSHEHVVGTKDMDTVIYKT